MCTDQLAGFQGKKPAALRKEFPVIAKKFEDICARVEPLFDRLIAAGKMCF